MKMDDGTVYGPADLNRLQAWAREGRVEPSSQISSDRKSWTPASLMPELGMEWLVEVETGGYYGPFHPDVIRDLIAKNRIPASARRFRLDAGRAQEDHSKELNAALERAKSSLAEKDAALVERESALAKAKALAAEQESALVKAKALLAEKDAALAEQKSLVAEKEASIAELKAALKAEHARADELEAALKAEHAHVEELGSALESARSEAATERTRCEELLAELKESKSEVVASASRIEELETALKAEHVRVENLLAQLVSAAEREKALRADLDLAHKTAASERKCVEAAIRRERQAEKEFEDARRGRGPAREAAEDQGAVQGDEGERRAVSGGLGGGSRLS